VKILGIETSSASGGICLADAETVLLETSLGEGMVHGRELVPAIGRAMDQAGWAPEELGLVAVSIGPGSFTGLRVGLTVAKVLAMAGPTALVAVPTLEVLVQNASKDAEFACAITNAHRGDVNACLFRSAGGEWRAEWAPRIWRPADLCADLPEGAFLLGEGLAVYESAFAPRRDRWLAPERWSPRAAWVARLGYQRYRQGQRDDPHQLVPVYLRLPPVLERARPPGPPQDAPS
jgi:tRNA threonylcarbamoyladenosine biosynthesis protein TsaB